MIQTSDDGFPPKSSVSIADMQSGEHYHEGFTSLTTQILLLIFYLKSSHNDLTTYKI